MAITLVVSDARTLHPNLIGQPLQRLWSREFKLELIGRLEASESGSALERECMVKRTIIYLGVRLGGPRHQLAKSAP